MSNLAKSKKLRKKTNLKIKARKGIRKALKPTKVPAPFYIVGIGASAGGLEAFKELLSHLPVDTGMAFVIIQHLSPQHESLLPVILGRETSMPVLEVIHGLKVLPNHVYVIPPNTCMEIHKGVLEVRRRDPRGHTPLTIDAFFKSLSSDQKEKAIGVVLSGTGADGAEGAKIIKAEGGISFAQSPESAQYASMPASAIRVDDIDFVLTPSEIAEELAKIKLPSSAELEEGGGFGEILAFLKRRVGTDFSQYKENTIHRRLSRRLIMNKISTLREYLKLLKTDISEATALSEDILIHVTEFFRESESLSFLKEKVFPQLLTEGREDALRIWIPGCSTGEEAYSIAITLVEYLEKIETRLKVQIFATDLSNKCIDKARLGKYGDGISEQVSPEQLQKYFTKIDTGYRINKEIRDLCVFARHDLTRDPPYSKLDLISCRNVLIYFAQPLQNRLMEMFHYSLNPDAFLLLGNSENVGIATGLFVAVDSKQKVYSKKSVLGKASSPAWKMDRDLGMKEIKRTVNESPLSTLQVQAEIDRAILVRYAPPAVVINANYDILQFRGDTEAFLHHRAGEANLNLLKMVRDGLGAEIREAVNRAKKKGISVRKEGLMIGRQEDACIEVTLLPLLGSQCFLITIEKGTEKPASKTRGRKNQSLGSTAVSRLERELLATKEKLQHLIHDFESANQELQSANEEVVSANEELQSTNEELETSKEELQSTNEELNTVNDELQSRNQELFVLSNDLLNLLNSIYIPILIVGNDLSIRRFTPTASKMLNVKNGDVGRPITDITSNVINVADLVTAIQEVIDTATIYEREIQDQKGHWHQLRVRPYKTQDQKLEGAVVTLLDIDQFKKSHGKGGRDEK